VRTSPSMDVLPRVLDSSDQTGLGELCAALEEVCGEPDAIGSLTGLQRIKKHVYRLRIDVRGHTRGLVLKRLDLPSAHRNQLVARRWLPALGLSEISPPLLGVAAERRGQWVWHVYEDIGDWALDAQRPDPPRVAAAVELIARLHTRAAGHPILPECHHHCGDLGMHYFTANVRDALHALERLRSAALELPHEHLDVRDRLIARLRQLLAEAPHRAEMMAEVGGHDTLLHGDLWTTNTFVFPTSAGLRARLIDWDHAAVGPFSYDLSTFLYRFPADERSWILALYEEEVAPARWHLPPAPELNCLFDTAECSRYANRAIWPAIALVQDGRSWALDELAMVLEWFDQLEPVLPE
jgi:thiamine kinase-like enzyme